MDIPIGPALLPGTKSLHHREIDATESECFSYFHMHKHILLLFSAFIKCSRGSRGSMAAKAVEAVEAFEVEAVHVEVGGIYKRY